MALASPNLHKPTFHYSFNYYEYKYAIEHKDLYHILKILNTYCGSSDPYPKGKVDSIYYDSHKEPLLAQCINGNLHKTKFRIRGYGEAFFQLQEKKKKDFAVLKNKSHIKNLFTKTNHVPEWSNISPVKNKDFSFQKITDSTYKYGIMVPSVKISYCRYRYRIFDYRITLDTNIEATAPINGIPRKKYHAIFPFHVLEIKTYQTRPQLPLLGIVSLPPVSCSKFLTGIRLLNE